MNTQEKHRLLQVIIGNLNDIQLSECESLEDTDIYNLNAVAKVLTLKAMNHTLLAAVSPILKDVISGMEDDDNIEDVLKDFVQRVKKEV